MGPRCRNTCTLVLRRCTEIRGLKGDRYVVRDLFGFRQTGVRDGLAVGEFYATGKVPHCVERMHAAGIDLPADLFAKRVLAVNRVRQGEARS
jgi:hypothetical protein